MCQRKHGETFEEFKIRRSSEQVDLKQYLKGTLFWDSTKNGKYVKPKEGNSK